MLYDVRICCFLNSGLQWDLGGALDIVLIARFCSINTLLWCDEWPQNSIPYRR